MTEIKLPVLSGSPSTEDAAEALAKHRSRGLLVRRGAAYRLYSADDIMKGVARGKPFVKIGHKEITFDDVALGQSGDWGILSPAAGISPDLVSGTLPQYYCPSCKFRSPPKAMPKDKKCPNDGDTLAQAP
jgi:hypothetical protein